MTSEIYFKNQNLVRQLGRTLPGPVYPKGSSIIPFISSTIFYIAQKPGATIGSQVSIYINGNLVGTTTIQDLDGTFIYGFKPVYGSFELKAVFEDGSFFNQFYTSTNLLMFITTLSQTIADFKIEAIKIIDNFFYNYNDIWNIGTHAGNPAFSNLGNYLNFKKPFDWTYERYADVIGGNTYTSIPGVLPSLRKGSTTGAIKDIVYSVTQHSLDDSAFTTLQKIHWRLSIDGAKYIYYNGVVETAAVGPHYFIKGTNALATPEAIIDSNVRKAFTILLAITSDGIVTDTPDVVYKEASGIDNLFYTYLNPWAPMINTDAGFQTIAAVVSAGITLPINYNESSLSVYLNGVYLKPSMYAINSNNEITLEPTLDYSNDDILQADFVITGLSYYNESFSPITSAIQLSHPAIYETLEIYLNGEFITDFIFDSNNPDIVLITREIFSDDIIDVRYASIAAPVIKTKSYIYDSGAPTSIISDNLIKEDYVKVYINGIRQSAGYSVGADHKTISIDYAGLTVVDGDVVNLRYAEYHEQGYNVRIVDSAGVEYSQGVHFTINYTSGKVIWQNIAQPQGTYYAYYTYFQKDILDNLLTLVRPATIRLVLQFTTTTGHIFKPYYFYGIPNPTGDVIF